MRNGFNQASDNFNNWGPKQLISVIKAQSTNHFQVHHVSYKLENPKFVSELSAILDLLLAKIYILASMFVCRFVCLSVCLSVCLLVCQFCQA